MRRMATRTAKALSGSRPLQGSSRMQMLGFLAKILAMAMRCFCPGESLRKPSPMMVSYPWGRREMKRWQSANLAAVMMSSWLSTPLNPYVMLYDTLPANITGSWPTIPTSWLYPSSSKSTMSVPSIVISPSRHR
mmetsp:Transcript_32925/g.104827  ORF Transcript_32925/g.104827 Transcript_32925/m.104827 type:complete len:134 (-) Transcript_32925:1992-2393(-)